MRTPLLAGPRAASDIGRVLLQEAEVLGARMLVVASHGPGEGADRLFLEDRVRR